MPRKGEGGSKDIGSRPHLQEHVRDVAHIEVVEQMVYEGPTKTYESMAGTPACRLNNNIEKHASSTVFAILEALETTGRGSRYKSYALFGKKRARICGVNAPQAKPTSPQGGRKPCSESAYRADAVLREISDGSAKLSS